MRGLDKLLRQHSFFKDLQPEYLSFIAGCGKNEIFNPGDMIAHEGEGADQFFILREGKVAIQIHTPNKGAVTLQTVGPDDIVGWSWLFPPYKWNFDIKALETTKMIALNGCCLREKCEKDHDLGYALMKKFSQIMVGRLQATRLQILDVYKGSLA